MKKPTLKQRAEKVEKDACVFFGITPNQYLERFHEMGCVYAERHFRTKGLFGDLYRRMVAIYITSEVYWAYWSEQWLDGCEYFLYGWAYEKKSKADFENYQLSASEPSKFLHQKIIKNGNNNYGQQPPAKTA
ncbi:MAG: hypothetical protein JEZ14_25830 [Marinilabiliaceae bacterium]|nr:hypothetical protein [Marinilabiliaceae bacterium]